MHVLEKFKEEKKGDITKSGMVHGQWAVPITITTTTKCGLSCSVVIYLKDIGLQELKQAYRWADKNQSGNCSAALLYSMVLMNYKDKVYSL